MMPDHARALRTCAVLAILATVPAFFLALAMAADHQWRAFAAIAFVTIALALIAARASYAFDRLRARHCRPMACGAMALGCALGSYFT